MLQSIYEIKFIRTIKWYVQLIKWIKHVRLKRNDKNDWIYINNELEEKYRLSCRVKATLSRDRVSPREHWRRDWETARGNGLP